MDSTTFQRRLDACLPLPQAKPYRSRSLWTRAGKRPIDLQLAEVGSLYWDSNSRQRQRITKSVGNFDPWSLITFIRRIGLILEADPDIRWIHAGLGVALIENARGDFRDLIVSLVILRHGTERAGINYRPPFDEAIAIAVGEVRTCLVNARDHSTKDVRITVREFGPSAWSDQPGE